jgi:hypothetical protein
MSSSPLRRVLSVSLLLAGLALVPLTAEAQVPRTGGPNDGSAATRFEPQGILEKLWDALIRSFATDGIRIDPNGGIH